MNMCWFGLQLPKNVKAEIHWGARAILDGRGYLDIPPDRQQMSDYENPARKKLAKWIPKQLKKIEKLRLDMVTGQYEADDGVFHMRANANGSHGYLYIVAWMDKEPVPDDKAADRPLPQAAACEPSGR
jgi:hypothetical protein